MHTDNAKKLFAEFIAIEMDGIIDLQDVQLSKKKRFRVIGDSKTSTSGIYYLHENPDGSFGGFARNFRSDHYRTFFYKPKNENFPSRSESDWLAFAEEKRKRAEAIEKERIEEQKQAAETALIEIRNYFKLEKPTPYMVSKGFDHKKTIKGILSDFRNQTLIIPIRDVQNNIVSLQRIYSNGKKILAKNARKMGCFHVIDDNESGSKLNHSKYVFFAEGFSTGLSIYLMILSLAVFDPAEFCVLITIDGGNMPVVAKEIKTRFPDKKFFIFGDDDHPLVCKIGKNSGKEFANATANVFGLGSENVLFPDFDHINFNGMQIRIPPELVFSPEKYRNHLMNIKNGLPPVLSTAELSALENAERFTDFNDLFNHKIGRGVLKEQLHSALSRF